MTARLAIFAEKPSILGLYRNVIASQNPGSDLSAVPVMYPFVGWMSGTSKRFQLPRGLKWSAYPTISDHKYSPLPFQNALPGYWAKPAVPVQITPSSRYRFEPSEWRRYHGESTAFFSDFQQADEIIVLSDCLYIFIHPTILYLNHIFGDEGGLNIRWVHLKNLTEESLCEDYNTHISDTFISDSFRSGEIRRFFDYNFTVNSLAILGETSRRAGLNGNTLSKYGLQTLLHLEPSKAYHDGEIYELMSNWVGTGKYNPESLPHSTGLGSATSKATIIENLLENNFLRKLETSSKRRQLTISDQGRRFIDFLHPRCKDSDLPFRLEEWSRMPMNEAKDKIGRYLRTFFGRQKRFLEKAT